MVCANLEVFEGIQAYYCSRAAATYDFSPALFTRAISSVSCLREIQIRSHVDKITNLTADPLGFHVNKVKLHTTTLEFV